MKVRILEEAEFEMEKAAHWYEEKCPGLGDEFLNVLARSFESIEDNPFQFAKYEGLRTQRDLRQYLFQKYPYYVIFEINSYDIKIVAVAHASRRPNFWRDRISE